MEQGIIVGANDRCAWLLPWWWKHYAHHNTYPVAFADFGLSLAARNWCQERGQILSPSVPRDFVAPKEAVDPELAASWENLYGSNVWQARAGWFYKPFALLATPFDISLWLDLDCEVCGSLTPVFEHLDEKTEVSLISDPGRPGIYNSGVVLFRRSASLLAIWAEQCIAHNAHFLGDDYALSPLIERHLASFKELPQRFNWMAGLGINTEALILHWASNWGKLFIETHGGYQDFRDSLLASHDPS